MSDVSVKRRDSNLELFRIITMLFIIAHHYVVNSGLLELIKINPLSRKSVFLLVLGMWGKTGINCFLFITGYFMCKSNITVKKFMKLLLEVYFYQVGIYLIFLFTGYEPFSVKTLIQAFMPFSSITSNFTGCFLVFYLFIPFLNILIRNITEKQHLFLVGLLFSIYVLFGSIPKFNISFNYVTWFCIIYIFASYIRMYPKPIYDNPVLWLVLTLLSIALAIVSILGFLYVGSKVNKFFPDFWLSDCNKIFAVLVAFTSFMLFKNLKIHFCNSLINVLGGGDLWSFTYSCKFRYDEKMALV